MVAAIAQNLGILALNRSKQAVDPDGRDVHLRRAVSAIEESLAFWLETNNRVNAAASYFQLGVFHRMLGEFDSAEEQLLQGLRIDEELNLPDAWKGYDNLAKVARARGDTKAAAEWQAKGDAKVAELNRLRLGVDTSAGVSTQLKDAVLALARVVHEVHVRGMSLPPDAAEYLAQLSTQPPPLGAVGDFLRDVADGASPPVPSGLPPEVAEILEGLRQALG